MADTFEFFGSKAELEEFKRKNNIVEDKKETKEEEMVQGSVRMISYENASEVNEDTLKMLRRTRHQHDAQTVYMQSDISFYDAFYTSSEDDVIDDKELLQEARAIRRIYKSYPEYLYATNIRELYMDALKSKVGNDMLFSVLSGTNKYWTPPIPIYSKRSADYDNGRYGIIDISEIFNWDDDKINELLLDLSKHKEIPEDPDKIKLTSSIITDNFTIINSDSVRDEQSNYNSTSVNLSDMDELQKIFRSWYQDDSAKESKKISEQKTLLDRAFSKTPERIEREYYRSQIPELPQSFSDLMNGVPRTYSYNPNEMVYDEYSGKPMSRKEHDARVLFRQLKDAGWTNELRMMKLLGVGSSREYAIIKTKQNKKKRKRNKKIGQSYCHDYENEDTGIYGDENIGNVELFSDLESLKAQMFPD